MLRMLVLYNKTGFFYDKGRPRGAVPDIAEEMERYLNKKLKTRAKKFKVVFIPVSPAQLEKYLNDGSGDLVATSIIVTPEREKQMDFTMPILSGEYAKLVIVTAKNAPQITSLDDFERKGNLCQSSHSFLQTPQGTEPEVEAGRQARDQRQGIRSQPHGRRLVGNDQRRGHSGDGYV